MLKKYKRQINTFVAFLVGALMFGVYFPAKTLAAAPPLEPGCYNNNNGNFVSVGCSTEGQARSIVAPYNKCFVINTNNGRQGSPVNREITCNTGAFITSASPDPDAGSPSTEQACREAGGTWRSVGTASNGNQYGFYCEVLDTPDEEGGDGGGGVDEGQTTEPGRLASRPNDCNAENLDGSNCGIINYLNIIMNLVSGAVAIAVIGNIIYAGIQYSMAQGDPGNVGKAKNRIRSALIAFIMYVSLFGFLQWLIPGGVF